MKDPLSYAKAKADWADAQTLAARRFHFDQTRRAYLQGQAARITDNVNEMARLEENDGYIFGPQRCDDPGRGRWPYG